MTLGNRAYFVVLRALVLAILLVSLPRPVGFSWWVAAGGILVFYVWDTDLPSSTSWHKQPAVPRAPAVEKYAHYQTDYEDELDRNEPGKGGRQYDFSAGEPAARPKLSAAERTGYRQLVGLRVPVERWFKVAGFVGQGRDFSLDERCPATQDCVRSASGAKGWNLTTGPDWKASIHDPQPAA
ncbi:hypothetical protein [Hymenobacter sp.]|uniref:hypothetical protein n=1 Tax=Hymenobacter sp. TaxID=1898978 RepID=UPI00286A8E0E|nr:hypothetical protein [Hymenobacter sp.]